MEDDRPVEPPTHGPGMCAEHDCGARDVASRLEVIRWILSRLDEVPSPDASGEQTRDEERHEEGTKGNGSGDDAERPAWRARPKPQDRATDGDRRREQ